jgi:hypothetical protein
VDAEELPERLDLPFGVTPTDEGHRDRQGDHEIGRRLQLPATRALGLMISHIEKQETAVRVGEVMSGTVQRRMPTRRSARPLP